MDISNEGVQLVHRYTKKRSTIPLARLIDMVALQIQCSTKGTDTPTPRIESIQVLPIITSKQITLSFRPNTEDSIDLEIDTEGVPVYLSFSKQDMKVTVYCSYGDRKRTIKAASSAREILLPFTMDGAKSVEMNAVYNGKDMIISANLR